MNSRHFIILFLTGIAFLNGCSQNQQKENVSRYSSDIPGSDIVLPRQPSLGLNRIDLSLQEGSLNVGTNTYLKSKLDSLLATGELEFESDSAFQFTRTMTDYLDGYEWTIFQVDGEFIPSGVEFRIFGAYKNVTANCFGFSSSSVGTNAALRSCDVSKDNILIYGIDPAPHQHTNEAPVELLAAFHPEIFVSHY